MNRQAIYNKVRNHLLKQNAKAQDAAGNCRYRAPEGRMCAVGCLIPDSRYTPAMETYTVRALIRVCNLLPTVSESTLELLSELQGVHDNCPVPEWPHTLAAVAERFGLQP